MTDYIHPTFGPGEIISQCADSVTYRFNDPRGIAKLEPGKKRGGVIPTLTKIRVISEIEEKDK
jgi:hypothetical protein